MPRAVSHTDLEALRALAHEVAEIAAMPVQQETISLWKALNSLRPVRPLALIDEIPWHEMDIDGELALRTEHKTARALEQTLRQTGEVPHDDAQHEARHQHSLGAMLSASRGVNRDPRC